MADRLTDKTEKTGSFAEDDLIHVVDISDTSDNASGSSFKAEIFNVLASYAMVRVSDNLILLKSSTGTNNKVVQAGDFVIYITTSRMIVGRAITSSMTVGEFDDPAKFAKFIDASPIIP